jgi:hypothetical protein
LGHAQRTPLKGLHFERLEEAETYLDHWENRWSDTRIHGTTKQQAMFAEEKPLLQPVPIGPFLLPIRRGGGASGWVCRSGGGLLWGLPPGWIGWLVKVQWDGLHVRILDPHTNQLIREHSRQIRGSYRINEEDYPKKPPLSTVRCWPEPPKLAPTSANSVVPSITNKESRLSGAFWECSP